MSVGCVCVGLESKLGRLGLRLEGAMGEGEGRLVGDKHAWDWEVRGSGLPERAIAQADGRMARVGARQSLGAQWMGQGPRD